MQSDIRPWCTQSKTRILGVKSHAQRRAERTIESMNIRFECPEDVQGIRSVNLGAFARTAEANLVDALRVAAAPCISLVAEEQGVIVGHALFTLVTVQRGVETWQALGLGPVAVAPSRQRRGVGTKLIQAGLSACKDAGHTVVFVVGHPSYYRRFGFLPAAPLGLVPAEATPHEAWMVNELAPGALGGRTGVVSYRPEFEGV